VRSYLRDARKAKPHTAAGAADSAGYATLIARIRRDTLRSSRPTFYVDHQLEHGTTG